MRIGLVSDTHLRRADQVSPDLLQALEGVEGIIHLGDITELAVLEAFEQVAAVEAVWGNVDPPRTRSALPRSRLLRLAGYNVAAVHGSGAPEGLAERLLADFRGKDIAVLLFGHSHRPEVRTVGGVLVVNPGSPVANPFSRRRTCGILHLEDPPRAEIIDLDALQGGGQRR